MLVDGEVKKRWMDCVGNNIKVKWCTCRVTPTLRRIRQNQDDLTEIRYYTRLQDGDSSELEYKILLLILS